MAASVQGDEGCAGLEDLARVGTTTPKQFSWLRSIRPKRATLRSFHSLMESMDGPRNQPPNCRNPPCDRGTGRRPLRVDCARSTGAAAQRRCEDPPAASRHEAPRRVRLRGDRLSPIAFGNGSRYPGAWRGCPRPWCGFAQHLQRDGRAEVIADTHAVSWERSPARSLTFQETTPCKRERLWLPGR